ncbi:MAG: dihydroneopterin aldolase [Verrucomicrobiota bacterium]
MKTDQITLHNVRAHGYHGVFPQEREQGQPFSATVTLYLSLSAVGQSDDLKDTVDYAAILKQVAATLGGEPFYTIEAVAERMAVDILEQYPSIVAVDVAVTKPQPPVDIPFDGVTATIHRTRQG